MIPRICDGLSRGGIHHTGNPLFLSDAIEDSTMFNADENRDRVMEMLHRMLAGDAALFRGCAVRAVGKMGVRDSIPALITLLRDEDPDVRVDAAVALGHLKAAEAVGALVENIEGDPMGEVRIEAVKALGGIGAREAVEPLIRCFEAEGYPELDRLSGNAEYGPWFEVQRQALEALGALGDGRAVETVIKALVNEDYEDIQESGIRVLAQLDAGKAREFLIGQLKSGQRLARRRAARALATLSALRAEGGGELPAGLLIPLVGALTDTDPDVRVSAAQALSGSENPMVAVSLSLLLNDPEPAVKKEVAVLFSGMHGKAVLDRLHAVLAESESDPALRRYVVQVLGGIGDAASVAPLDALLDDLDRDLAFEVIRALGKIGGRGPERKLAGILADEECHHTVRTQAAWALGRLGQTGVPEAADSLVIDEVLRRAVADADGRVAQAALVALVELAPASAADMLVAIVRGETGDGAEPPPLQERETARGMSDLVTGQTPQTSTLAAILVAEKDRAMESASGTSADKQLEESSVPGGASAFALRILAARLLGGLENPGTLVETALLEACESGDVGLRREALLALGRLGGVRAISALVAGLDAGEKEVRLVALDALSALNEEHAAGGKLSALLEDPDPGVRVSVVRALAKGKGEQAVAGLCRALGDSNLQVCRAALSVLSASAYSPECRESILALMFRFGGGLRMEAAATLRRLNDYAVADRLLKAVAAPDREKFQWIAIDARGELYAEEPMQ